MDRHLKESSKRAFIAAKAFNNDFFTYTPAKKGSNAPTLAAVTTDATKCPPGRVLRENGRKLFPGANPGVDITTVMVGVFDNQSMLSGFIDPNSPVFAVYNTDLPAYLKDGVDPGPDGCTDKGAPVYTNGIIVQGSNYWTVPLTSGDLSVDPTLGSFVVVTNNSGVGARTSFNIVSTVVGPIGHVIYVSITNFAGNATVTFTTGFRSTGQFVVNSTKTGTVSFISDGTNYLEISRAGAAAAGY